VLSRATLHQCALTMLHTRSKLLSGKGCCSASPTCDKQHQVSTKNFVRLLVWASHCGTAVNGVDWRIVHVTNQLIKLS
jgi:hypothetical protein